MMITLGFSPCPNDTFIFDALMHQKIDCEGLSFKTRIEDVETLNRMAMQDSLDMVKISYHAFLYLSDRYEMLHSGSAHWLWRWSFTDQQKSSCHGRDAGTGGSHSGRIYDLRIFC